MRRRSHKFEIFERINAAVEAKFGKAKKSFGTTIEGREFKNTLREVGCLRYAICGKEVRPWTNLIPINARERCKICNLCLSRELFHVEQMGPDSGHTWRRRGNPWRERKNKQIVEGRWRFSYDGAVHVAVLRFPMSQALVLTREQLDDLAEVELERHRRTFLEANWGPFDLDGCNIASGDWVHCLTCPASMEVIKWSKEKGLEEYRAFCLRADMQRFHGMLFNEIRTGEHERRLQEYLDELNRKSDE